MQEKSQKQAYADPTSALSSYLDDLLHVATNPVIETAEVEEPPVETVVADIEAEAEAKNAEREARRARVREQAERVKARRRAEAEKATAAQALADSKQIVTPVTTPDIAPPETKTVDVPTPAIESAPAPQGRPEWADRAFECLIFKVAGLQLAVPLVLLGAIHRVETDMHQIPGRPRWFMGMLPSGDHNLRVVDTAEWVMAGRVPEGARDGYRFVIRLDQSEWGLACDEVAQSFTLKPDDVRWRSERSRRPWLAGTVVDHMCALLDVRAMTQLLSCAEKEQRLDLG